MSEDKIADELDLEQFNKSIHDTMVNAMESQAVQASVACIMVKHPEQGDTELEFTLASNIPPKLLINLLEDYKATIESDEFAEKVLAQ